MQAVFPGKPQAKLQAVSTTLWEDRRLVAYVSGNALIILGGPNELLQTISHNDDDDLCAVAIDPLTGKIATCTADAIHVYKPFDQAFGELKWSLQHSLIPKYEDKDISALSWGEHGELLAAGSSLTLFSTQTEAEESWSRKLANPAKHATFSHDASLIATTGWCDRLVKIWQRSYLGENSERLDATYLPHPGTVTGLQWRGRPDQDHHYEYVLYTTCTDNKLRVWTSTDHHSLQAMQIWTELDLGECIQLREPLSPSKPSQRYVFIINNWDFKNVIDRAVEQRQGGEREQYTLAHLQEVASESPEVCVVLDDKGNMSAWGLERIGCKARQQTDIFNMAHTEGVNLGFLADNSGQDDHLQVYGFTNHKGEPSLNILAHHFDGRLGWLNCAIYRFFDPSSDVQPLSVAAMWTGHDSPIDQISRSIDRESFVSLETDNEFIVWDRPHGDPDSSIERRSSAKIKKPIQKVLLIHHGMNTVFLHEDSVSLWATRTIKGHKIAEKPHGLENGILLFEILFETSITPISATIILVSKDMKLQLYNIHSSNTTPIELMLSCQCPELPPKSLLAFVEQTKDSNSIFDKQKFRLQNVAMSYDAHGMLSFWDIEYTQGMKIVPWKCTKTLSTDMFGAKLIRCSADLKTAIIDTKATSLTIWDGRTGLLEFSHQYQDHEVIEHVEWMSKDMHCPLLAIAFAHKVRMYIQQRYDYLDSKSSWTLIRELDLTPFTTVPIAGMTWLAQGELVVAAGLQTFTFGNQISINDTLAAGLSLSSSKELSLNMFSLSKLLNSQLPIFHPQYLFQCVLKGQPNIVPTIKTFDQTLKFYTEGDDLDSFLNKDIMDCFGASHHAMNGTVKTTAITQSTFENDTNEQSLSEDAARAVCGRIEAQRIPHLSMNDRSHLLRIVKSLGAVDKQKDAVDEAGMRYLIALNHRHIEHEEDKNSSLELSWRDICWASRSNSQDILFDVTSKFYKSKLLWNDARDNGVFMWMSDNEALKVQFENIARNEYTKTDERNPIDCSLFYLALRKKQVLRGLWRIASWNREQGATMRLLGNDFEDPRWKTAALKNAYALMGRRRTQYAAAFFVLADHLKDACAILSNQLGDLQLAIAVARVYEGDNGPVLKDLLLNIVLPKAIEEGNKWLASWAFLMLDRKNLAMEALTTQSRSYLSDDPSLLSFYIHLRSEIDPTRRDSQARLSQKQERDFVMHCAQLYSRIGCDLLAVDLLRNFKFSPPESPASKIASPIEIPSPTSTARSVSPTDSVKSPRSPDREQRRRRRKSSRKASMSSLNAVAKSPSTSTSITNDILSSPSQEQPRSNPQKDAPPSMLDDYFSSSSENPKRDEQASRVTAQEQKDVIKEEEDKPAPGTTIDGKPRKIVLEEPSTASILDDFDF